MGATHGITSIHPFLAIFLVVIAIDGNRADPRTVKIRHQEVKYVTQVDEAEEGSYTLPFEQVCQHVVNKLFIVPLYYIDEEDEPEVGTCSFQYESGEEITQTAIICATVPSIYLIAGDEEIIALTVKSAADNFRMIREIVSPTTVELAVVAKGLRENPLSRLTDDGRQSLCIQARKESVFLFTDSYVLKPHTYEFQYHDKRVHINAILCPSYPPIYLSLGGSEDEIILIAVREVHEVEIVKEIRERFQSGEPVESRNTFMGITNVSEERYEDELQKRLGTKLLSTLSPNGRKSMCLGAFSVLNYAVDAPETYRRANYFEFDHGHGLKSQHFAIPCFPNNEVLLYFEKVTARDGALIKIVIHRKSKLLKSSTTKRTSPPEESEEGVEDLINNFTPVTQT